MRMRVTTSMAMNTYRYNLQNSTQNLTNSRNTVLSHRKFDSFSADPSSAIQAWRIRRAMVDNNSYQSNNQNTYSRFRIAWETMGVINNDLIDKDGRVSDVRAADDATAGGRQPLGQILEETAQSIIQAMNSAKYGDHFVFSGDDEMNAPFSWDGDTLLYRGVNVNAGGVPNPKEAGEPDWGDLNEETNLPKFMPAVGSNTWEQGWIDYYKAEAQAQADGTTNTVKKPSDWADPFMLDPVDERTGVPVGVYNLLQDPDNARWTQEDKAWAEYYKDQSDLSRLTAMAKEHENVDLGMGLQEDEANKLINGTAFDRSLPGIDMLGYGVDEDGDPKNVVLILKRLGEIFSNCDAETGAYDPEEEKAAKIRQEADRLMDKLNAARHSTTGKYVEVETKAHFLVANQERLESQGDYLNEERATIEDVDLADAITAFSWDYYCYSAALKVGTQLLSQSLIDYMN